MVLTPCQWDVDQHTSRTFGASVVKKTTLMHNDQLHLHQLVDMTLKGAMMIAVYQNYG